MQQTEPTPTTTPDTDPRPMRACLTVSLHPDTRRRVLAAAAGLGLPVSRLVDLLIDGKARLEGDKATIG